MRVHCFGLIGLALLATQLSAADWNMRQAANYLDARAKAWTEWPTAKVPGGTCVSCHTNLTYLIARPALT